MKANSIYVKINLILILCLAGLDSVDYARTAGHNSCEILIWAC